MQFSYSAAGKPSLSAASLSEHLNFNLSHSDGLAVCAFSRDHEVGIDVESLRPFADMKEIAARCFSPAQQSDLQSLQTPAQEEKFFRYWTRKEAILKCSGEGFSDAPMALDDSHFDGVIQELQPAEGYLAALAARGNSFTLKTWQLNRETFE